MRFTFFPQRIYQTVILGLLIAILCTIFHRARHYDEAWFAEQSFWLVQQGKIRSELFRGYNHWEDQVYVAHKLFIGAGALVMAMTGFTVATSKLVSILFGLIGACLVWFSTRYTSKEQQYIALFLYVGCGSLIRYLAINRPEMMCMTLGFASYMALNPPGTSSSKPALAGILAGLAALTHLNGLIYLLAGAVWLFIKREKSLSFRFILAGGVTLSLYGLDALVDGNLAELIQQFRADPATQDNLSLAAKLKVMIDYHQIFFHSQNEALLTAVVIIATLLAWKRVDLSNAVVLYSGLLILFFWFLTKSDTDIYFLLFMPWFVLLASQSLLTRSPTDSGWQKKVRQSLLIAYLIGAVFEIGTVLRENSTALNVEAHNALLATYMPQQQVSIIAPIDFFFGQMNHYKIRGLTSYYLLERRGERLSLPKFFDLAAQHNITYIISDYGREASYNIPVDAPNKIGMYTRIFQDKWNAIYARR